MQSTTRRKFLASVSAAASAGLTSLAPRAPGFLLESAALGAERPAGERILVVVQLSGGNDGLNTVIPYEDEVYRSKRPSLALGAGNVIKLERGLALHPRMKGFESLLEKRWLSIVQGVGYPNPNRSHFESMDIWHTAHLRPQDRAAGWLGRAFDAQRAAGRGPSDPPGMHLGGEVQPLALAARDVPSPSLRSLDQFKLQTDEGAGRAQAIEAAASARRPEASDLLKFVQTRTTAALEISRRIAAANQAYKTPVAWPESELAGKLKQVAQLIDAGLTTRVYYVALDGFDTHSDQANAHAGLLNQLSGALAAFAEDLQAHGHLSRVLTLVFSEFGRRAQENASRGTDHGAAAPVFLVGSKVKPGLVGQHPKLNDLADGDLKFHTDFRAVYAALLSRWLGWPAEPILGEGFAPADVLA
jgi:uncharacterized protein (DUF1501 family)